MNETIKELFALPVGLTPVITINEVPLYGSKTLNEKLIEAMKISKRGRFFHSKISELVNNGMIIPCFADNSLLRYFRRKISKDNSGGLLRMLRYLVAGKKPINHPLDYVLAFYDFQSNKIVILISNHINEAFSSTASDESIALSLTHEMMHLYAHQNPYKFINYFKDELNSYYTKYFTKIFDLKDDKSIENLIEQTYKFLFLKFEMNNESIIPLSQLRSKLIKFEKYSNLEKDKFKEVVIDYLKVVYIFYKTDIANFINLTKHKYKYIIVPLYDSYKDAFGKVPVKGALQEMIFPSEVICGYSDMILDSKVKNSLKSI